MFRVACGAYALLTLRMCHCNSLLYRKALFGLTRRGALLAPTSLGFYSNGM